MSKCNEETIVYKRCVGYYAPVECMNDGKQEELKDRKMYDLQTALDKSVDLKTSTSDLKKSTDNIVPVKDDTSDNG